MYVRRGVMALLWLTCLASPAPAQYRFDSWTADTGLPQNIIRAIHQTSDGYLWLATLDGLARFDGVRFTVFNKGNSPGIESNRFTELYEDLNGALWLGTENSGLTRYYRGEFTTYTTQNGLSSNVIRGVFGDQDGNVSVLSREKVMRWANGQFRHGAPHIFSIHVHCGQTVFHRNNRGGVWCVSHSSLSRFVNGRLTSWTRQDGLPSLNISAVAEDSKGTLWVATRDAGLVEIEAGRVAKVWTVNNGLPGNQVWFITSQQIKALSRDNQGALWITDLDSGRNHLLTRKPPAALLDLESYRLYEDREGNVWIGTEGDGLYRARQQSITVYSKQDGLVGRNIYPVYEDSAGAIWIGTFGSGLGRFKDEVFTNYTVSDGLTSNDVTSL
jgi:ligand-binding sensor domain-containing protein